MKSHTQNYIFLFLVIGVLIFLLFQKDTPVEKEIKANNDKIEQLEKEEENEIKDREIIKEEIEELETQKSTPYGKKDFTANESVLRAERYFSRRYGKD